jgi:hypothetical protein
MGIADVLSLVPAGSIIKFQPSLEFLGEEIPLQACSFTSL